MRGTNCLAAWLLILCILPSCAVTRSGRPTVPISTVDRFMLQSPELGPALSAVQELKQSLGIRVISIIRLNDLINTLEESTEYGEFHDSVVAYRKKYGVLS